MTVSAHRLRNVIAALVAGILAGALLLGIGGRLAMLVLALSIGLQPEFSWGGSFDVVVLGTIYGAAGGAILAVLRDLWPRSGQWAGAISGLILVGAAWAMSAVGRQAAAANPAGVPLIFIVSAVLFLAYGFAANALVTAWHLRRDRSEKIPELTA